MRVIGVGKTFFIPARGRKQCDPTRRRTSGLDCLYPREGTETDIYHDRSYRYFYDFLYPREGTETGRGVQHFPYPDFLYPREGTETSFSASPNRIMQ